MPAYCSAYGCNNRRNTENTSRGVTFHKFPKEKKMKRKWEIAVRRKNFTATQSSVLCSEHFKPPDFDRTGQIVRLREGVIPSVFNFPSRPQKPTAATPRTTKTSIKAEESLPVTPPQCPQPSQPLPESDPPPNVDHSYALPDSPALLKARLSEALARVESLERERHNAKAREQRAKKTVQTLMEDLKKKNLVNEELKEKLHFYSDLQLDLLSKQGHEYTKDQREFALTLHLYGPKAYNYLRDSLHLPLPHPHTLQRWTPSKNATS